MARKTKVRAKASEVIRQFTKPWCEKATRGDAVQRVFWEEKTRGFGLRVGAKRKTWLVQRTVNGKTVAVDVGHFPAMDPEEARRLAKSELSKMEEGKDPQVEKRKARAQGITLREARELWVSDGKASPRTISDNEYLMSRYLPDWLDRPLMEFGDDDGRKAINERYRKIIADVKAGRHALKDGKKPRPNKLRTGSTSAANTFRHYRLLWRRAMKQSSLLPVCPTINIAFPKYEARKAGIPFDDLAAWYRGVQKIDVLERRDLLLTMISLGLRRNDAQTLRWEHVDFENRVLHIPDPKGGEAFYLPIPKRLLALLRQRKRDHDKALMKQLLPERAREWCFGAWSASGHIVEARDENVGVAFIPHGLRNTFANAARKANVSQVHIGCLMHHKQPGGHITQDYQTVEFKELRAPAQRIEDTLYRMFERKPSKVVALRGGVDARGQLGG